MKNDDGPAISLLKMCDAELRDKIFFFFSKADFIMMLKESYFGEKINL